VSVVALDRQEVIRLIHLPASAGPGAGQVLLSADGAIGYALDQAGGYLTAFDTATGRSEQRLPDVQAAALNGDAGLLFLAGAGGSLRALRLPGLAPLWDVSDGPFGALAANGDTLAAAGAGRKNVLSVYSSADGRVLGSVVLTASVQGLAASPAGGWAVRLGGAPPALVRFDSQLRPLATVPVPAGEGLFYDAPRRRYLLSGLSSAPSRFELLALAEGNLAILARQEWSWQLPPSQFAADGDGLVGLTRFQDDRLYRLDPQTLRPAGQIALGVRLSDLALDAAGGILYVADDQDRIHVLDLPGGQEQAIWTGRAPLALDAAHDRLYTARAEGVVALSRKQGQVLVQYAQGGVPAPDPCRGPACAGRDLVYLVERGVTVYNRAGQKLATLASTFPRPQGLSPNPYALSGWVNPLSGSLLVTLNNGVPGSNNSSYLALYPPAIDRPLAIPHPYSFVVDVAFDPVRGRMFAAYGGSNDVARLQALDASGHVLAQLDGRTGALAFDPAANALYVARAGVLVRLGADRLDLQGVFRAPDDGVVAQMVVDGATRRLYVRGESSPQVTILPLDALPPLDTAH
jgi:DNA-binding beta-propeller fold protein YncE